jgi:hypothetical protein
VARMKSVIQLEKQAAADEIKPADDSVVPGV